MSRWTHNEEDAYRLPEGFTRIGYDADSRTYTFKDKQGVKYHGEPGAEYGILIPVSPSTVSTLESVRPRAFAPSNGGSSPIISPSADESALRTFQEILPPELITSSTLSTGSRLSRTSKHKSENGKSKEAPSVRPRALAVPIMKGVVSGLRRSMTSMRKRAYTQPGFSTKHESLREDDRERLMQTDSRDDICLPRMSISTAISEESQEMSSRPSLHRLS